MKAQDKSNFGSQNAGESFEPESGRKAGWGKEPGQQCAFVCVQPSLCALGVGVCLPVSAFFPILDF